MESRVEIRVVWQDDDVIEVLVLAASDQFSGEVVVYTTAEALAAFAEAVSAFPRGRDDVRTFSFSNSKDGNHAHFTFRAVDSTGHSVVVVSLLNIDASKQSATVVVPVEGSTVDSFVPQLRSMAERRAGTAVLPSPKAFVPVDVV